MTADQLHEGVERGDLEAVREILRKQPEIVNQHRPDGGERLALHIAVLRRDMAMTRLLMEHGADARSGIWPYRKATEAIVLAVEHGYDEIANIIQEAESRRTPAPPPEIDPAIEAVRRGDLEWLRARHAEGNLPSDGLLTAAVQHNRPEILASLLDWGFDPNAWACVWSAYRQRDAAMIELLARYGGVPNAATPGYLRDTELAARMFAEEAAGRLPKGTVREGHTVAEEVLDPAASAGATAGANRLGAEGPALVRDSGFTAVLLESHPMDLFREMGSGPKHLPGLFRAGAGAVPCEYVRTLRNDDSALCGGVL